MNCMFCDNDNKDELEWVPGSMLWKCKDGFGCKKWDMPNLYAVGLSPRLTFDKQVLCKHCHTPIFYESRDTVWLHTNRTEKNDNGYYCAGESYLGKCAEPEVK